jgi:hypothetical protein
MKGRFIFGAVAALGLLMTTSQPAAAQGQSASHPNPVGAWLLEVTFLSGDPPPFKEMITLHSGGTDRSCGVAVRGRGPPRSCAFAQRVRDDTARADLLTLRIRYPHGARATTTPWYLPSTARCGRLRAEP